MDQFCRTCSRSDDFQKFELSTISQISNVRIDDMLVYCTQQQISTGDSLPQNICAECFAALNSAFVFRKLTYQSENGFRQMINSSSTDSDRITSGVAILPIPVEMTNHVLHEVAIKEEEIELDEPLLEEINHEETKNASITDEDDIICTSESMDGTEPDKKSDKTVRSFAGPTTYLCKDCGYTTQHCYNFKRHQKNQNHSIYSKIMVKRPISMIKHIIKPFMKSSKPPSTRPRKIDTQKAKGEMPRRNPIRTRYRCDDCGYQNYVAYNFRRHQKTWNHMKVTTINERIIDTEPNVIKCLDCLSEFSSQASLKAHCENECKSMNDSPDSNRRKATRNAKRKTAQELVKDQMVEIKEESRYDEVQSDQGNTSTEHMQCDSIKIDVV